MECMAIADWVLIKVAFPALLQLSQGRVEWNAETVASNLLDSPLAQQILSDHANWRRGVSIPQNITKMSLIKIAV